MSINETWWIRGEQVLAGGPATYSKSWTRYPANAPKLLAGAKGAHVWDMDGNRYIDTVAGLGPVLLGHRDPRVDAAVHRQVSTGVSFSLLHPLEVEVAEMLCEMIPCAEQVRFCKNGADATQAAVRLARHVTGKRHVICSGYHGHHDWYIASTDKAGGILEEVKGYTHQVPWGITRSFQETLYDITNWSQESGGLAALILEVPPRPWGEDPAEVTQDLKGWRQAADDTGALFILDEVVTGFRYGLGGAQAMYGVTPDLACFGKGLANGYPLAALVGRRELMRHFADGDVFFSTTAGGEAMSLAAAKATLEVLRTTGALENLDTWGTSLGTAIHGAILVYQLPCRLRGNYARMVLEFDDMPGIATAAQLRTVFQRVGIERGVLFGPLVGPVFPMTTYTEDTVNEIVMAVNAACRTLYEALDAG